MEVVYRGCCFCFSHTLYKPCRPLSLCWVGIWPSLEEAALPSGVFHLLEIPPTHSFLSGLCCATFYLVFWRCLPSENLPAANWPQHIKSFTLISFFGSTGRYTGLLWLFDSALNFGSVCFPNLTFVHENPPQPGEEWILCPFGSRIATWGGLGFQFRSMLEFWVCPARRWPSRQTQEWRDSICHLSLGEF